MMIGKRLALVALLGTLAAASWAQTVYSNDFSANASNFTTSGRVDLPTTANAASPLSSMLGKFANNEFTNLNLTGLIPNETYTIDFDLFIGGSWDGKNNTFGPDCWILRENYADRYLVNTTYSRVNDPGFRQDYSDSNPTGGGSFNAGTGADVTSSNPDLFAGYNIYYFGGERGNPVLSFTSNSAGMASLTFQGIGLQNVNDEYWAIDNVVVRRVPEPGTALLALLSVPALGLLRRRK
jgi:hypothetical protein